MSASWVCFFTSVLALGFAIGYGKRISTKKVASTLQQVERTEAVRHGRTEEEVDCKDSDCEWSFDEWRCQPADLGPTVSLSALQTQLRKQCVYRYEPFDMTPSKSCRCAGAGALTAKYGSLEDAFAALSKGSEAISLSEFTELMTKYNVPGYTAAYEFAQADKDKSHSLSEEEFREAAENLMAATTGGDKALGSAGSRCCCKKELPEAKSICLNPDTLETYTLSGDKISTDVEAYAGATTYHDTGSTCDRSCASQGTTHKFIGKLGQASSYASGFQAGSKEYVRFGDAFYVESEEQTYEECLKWACFKRENLVKNDGVGGRRAGDVECSSFKPCHLEQTVSYCGYSKLDTGLVRYDRVGTVGQCIDKDNLDSKLFVGHKVCPSGTYHSTRAKTALQLCDCADKCP